MGKSCRRSLHYPNGKGTYEHVFKHKANRALRRAVKMLERDIESGKTEDPLFPDLWEVSDVWCFPKDGKRYSPLDWVYDFYKDDPKEMMRILHKALAK